MPTGTERRKAVSGWEPLLDRYTVHRIGRRVCPIGRTFAEMAVDVARAIDELDPPVDVLGASTGGVIALHMAAARPELVRRLVVVISGTSASPYGRRMGERARAAIEAGRWRRAFGTIMPIGGRTRVARFGFGVLGWLLGPRLIGIPADPTLVLAELDAWLRDDVGPAVEKITCPTLVIGAERDPVFPPRLTRDLASRLPHASVTIVPNVAHDFPASMIADHISPFLG